MNNRGKMKYPRYSAAWRILPTGWETSTLLTSGIENHSKSLSEMVMNLAAGKVYYNLSLIAIGRWELDTAEKWLRKSIHIYEKQGDEIGASESYNRLGAVVYLRRDLGACRAVVSQVT